VEDEDEEPMVVKTAPKKEEPAKADAAEEEWKDNTYKCIDCGEDWVDPISDQEFRWDKGFAETPKRCKDCRWAKKQRMEGGDGGKGKGKDKGKGKGKGKDGKDGKGKGGGGICYKFQAGNCTFTDCKFSHEG